MKGIIQTKFVHTSVVFCWNSAITLLSRVTLVNALCVYELIKSTKIATSDDNPVGRCASVSSCLHQQAIGGQLGASQS